MADTPATTGERTILASPFPAAGGRVLVSPFQFLVTGEDNLRIEGWSSVSGAVLAVAYRFADTKGRIVANVVRVPLTSDRLVSELDVKLGEGYLVNMSIFVVGAAPLIGQVFTCIKLIRGFTGATIVLGLLAQGYVTHEQGFGWPGSPLVTSLEGPGVLRYVIGTDPAPGAEILEVVPTGARWELHTFSGVLVPNATVATRRPFLALMDTNLNTWFRAPHVGTAAASETRFFGWGQGTPYETVFDANALASGLPGAPVLLAGHGITTSTSNLQPGDNWTPPRYLVTEWLEAS